MTFRDADKKFELQGDRSEMITNKNYTEDFANLSYKNLMYEFVKEK